MNKHCGSFNQSFVCTLQNLPTANNEMKQSNGRSTPVPLVKVTSSQYFEICAAEGFTNEMREKYLDALEYINFCHRVMNKLLRKKCQDSGDMEDHLSDFKIPETANFLSILDLLLTESKRVKNCNQNNEPRDNFHRNILRSNCYRGVQEKNVDMFIPGRDKEVRNSNTNCTENDNREGEDLNNKQVFNVAKTLLQNNVKQLNLENNNVYQIQLQNSKASIKGQEVKENEDTSYNDSEEEELDVDSLKADYRDEMDKELGEHSEEPFTPPNPNKSYEETPHDADYNNHLMNLIKKQIRSFLQSPNSDFNNAYVNRRENLDIDNFRVVDITSQIDIDNYSTNNNKERQSVDQISRNPPADLSVSSSTSSAHSQLTYEYRCANNNICEDMKTNENSSNKNGLVTSTSVNYIQYARKREEMPLPVKRVEYTLPNISATKAIERRVDTRQVFRHGEVSSDSDGNDSTILSDDELNNEAKMNNANKNMKSVDKVINAFNPKKKGQKRVHVSKCKPTPNQENFNHPLNLNKREIHSLSKEVLSSMGLFTETGEMRPEVLAFLKEEENSKKNNDREKVFRKSRSGSEEVKNIDQDAVTNLSISCESSSDIRSDCDFVKRK